MLPALPASSGKKNKFGHFLVVVQLIHRLTQADISCTTKARLFFFPLLVHHIRSTGGNEADKQGGDWKRLFLLTSAFKDGPSAPCQAGEVCLHSFKFYKLCRIWLWANVLPLKLILTVTSNNIWLTWSDARPSCRRSSWPTWARWVWCSARRTAPSRPESSSATASSSKRGS